MWKVESRNVFQYLFVTDIFLTDVFDWLKANKNKSIEQIEEELFEDTSLLGEVANNLDSLFNILLNLISHENIDEIIKTYDGFEKNYLSFLISGASIVTLSNNANKIIKEVFEYFYSDLLTRKAFWDVYNNGNKGFSRSKFRVNLGRIRPVCPYCDAAKIEYYKHSNSDHFLAYTHFPFLSIHWANLVVSCLGCNLYIKNDKFIGTSSDGITNNIPIFHPYFNEAADFIQFEFDDQLNISIKESTDDRVKNYLSVFELQEVYRGAIHDVKTLWDELVSLIILKYENFQYLAGETMTDRLKRLYTDTIVDKKQNIIGAKGKVNYSKLLIDLCDFKLSDYEMSRELSFLYSNLGISELPQLTTT